MTYGEAYDHAFDMLVDSLINLPHPEMAPNVEPMVFVLTASGATEKEARAHIESDILPRARVILSYA
jgi:hypothetical protein